jgi:hypothetical protein
MSRIAPPRHAFAAAADAARPQYRKPGGISQFPRERLGDVCLAGPPLDGSGKIEVFVFIEHQSTALRFVSPRRLEYIAYACREHLDGLPPPDWV